MSDTLFQLKSVTKSFDGRPILDRLSWSLKRGECAVILGPSGGGKSVFLHTLLGFHEPDSGVAMRPGGGDNADLFRHVAVMFQEDALFEDRTVEANLAIAHDENPGAFRGPFSEATEKAIDNVLREVELDPAQVRRALPSALSGGMRRRVALARAVIRKPDILVADEPTTGLDPSTADRVYELLGRLIQRHNMSAVIISHDPACASRLGRPVYFFSPTEGELPRWPESSGELPPDERHKRLTLWMTEQIDSHRKRAAEPGAPREIPDEPVAPASYPLQFFWDCIDDVGRAAMMFLNIFKLPNPSLLLHNLLSWGLGTVPLAAIIFILLGVVMQVQAESAVVDYGLSNRLPELVALSLLRLSPILTGFLMAGRCGSAIAARLGWMELSGGIRAMRTLRLDPDRALLPPLCLSLVIATPLLALAGLGFGFLGAVLVQSSPHSQSQISITFFVDQFPNFITQAEILLVIVKGILTGLGLTLITYTGAISPKRSPDQVTQAITRGLVLTFIWITITDSVLGLLYPI